MKRATVDTLMEVAQVLGSEIGVLNEADACEGNSASRQQACTDAAARLRSIASALRTAIALKVLRDHGESNGGNEPLEAQLQCVMTPSGHNSGTATHRPSCIPVSAASAISICIKENKLSRRKPEFLQRLQPPPEATHGHDGTATPLGALQEGQREQRAWCYLMGAGSAPPAQVLEVYNNLQLSTMASFAREHIDLTTRLRLAKDLAQVDEGIESILVARRRSVMQHQLGEKRSRDDATAKAHRQEMLQVIRCQNGLAVIQVRNLCVLYMTYNASTRKWALLSIEWTILAVIEVEGVAKLIRLAPHQHQLVLQAIGKRLVERGLRGAIHAALLAGCGVLMEHTYCALLAQQTATTAPTRAVVTQSVLNIASEQGFIALKALPKSEKAPTDEGTVEEPMYTQLRIDFGLGTIRLERRLGADVRSMKVEDWLCGRLSRTLKELVDQGLYLGHGCQDSSVRYAVVDINALREVASTWDV